LYLNTNTTHYFIVTAEIRMRGKYRIHLHSRSIEGNWYWVFPGGKERPGRDAHTSPPSSAVGHERVELYLYSPYGPYGLYSTDHTEPQCLYKGALYLSIEGGGRAASVCV